MDYTPLAQRIAGTPLAALTPQLQPAFLDSLRHGDFQRWRRLESALPRLTPSVVEPGAIVRIGRAGDIDTPTRAELSARLRELIPWRKGPFELFGIAIDAEWRSDLKWTRLVNAIAPLAGKTVLDVGCGNGYHCFRMLESGAAQVLGIDSHLPYVGQFWALKHFLPELPVDVLPLALEQWPAMEPAFDTVFSMGVLYHARSPLDHLLHLKRALKPGGELVLESIVVPGDKGYALTPSGRYARMGNVWFVPGVATTVSWLERCGFEQIRVIDESPTMAIEQRKTEWMPFDSLEDSLDPNDSGRTIEGYPAPRRAVILAAAGTT
ncbi:MAG: tRNA 5-methoxyuridine(34)/uridine 5-oxyacetic acid(34) synthase CmoB [Pseudohongiellaceae bacterium]